MAITQTNAFVKIVSRKLTDHCEVFDLVICDGFDQITISPPWLRNAEQIAALLVECGFENKTI